MRTAECRCRSRSWCGACRRGSTRLPAPRLPLGVRRDRRRGRGARWSRSCLASSNVRRRSRRDRRGWLRRGRAGGGRRAHGAHGCRATRRRATSTRRRTCWSPWPATPSDCEGEHGRVDVGEEAQPQPRAARAARADGGAGRRRGRAARPLLDDVEGLLREVAALPACARADSLDAIHRQMERRNVLMKIDLHDEGAARMRRLLLAGGAPLCGVRGLRPDGRRARAGGEGADPRPQVRGGAHGLDRDPGQARGPATPTRRRTGSRARSERLGEHERAFKEYGTFLARRPGGSQQVEEARTSRIGLADQALPGRPGLVRDRAAGGAHRHVQDRALLRGPPAGRPRCAHQPGRAARCCSRCSRTRRTRTCSTACASSC